MLISPDDVLRITANLSDDLSQLLTQIPSGRVSTYGALATALGNTIASRWVGKWMLHHDHDDNCPCHRVVRADGSLGLYIDGDQTIQARRLKYENVETCRGHIDLASYSFSQFQCDRPLRRLSEYQNQIAQAVQIGFSPQNVRTVGGVDVSYVSEEKGVAAYCLIDSN